MIVNLTGQPIEVLAAADGEPPKRTIMGVAVPWNVTASASTGNVRFLPGSLPVDGPAPKLLRDHDLGQPVGIVTERVDTAEGMMFSARLSATGAGDEALVLASDGVLDAVSVGVIPTEYTYEGDTMVVSAGQWRELSLVPFGAFDTARVHQVAAEAADEDSDAAEADETEESNQTEEEAPVTEATIPTSPIVVAAATTRPRITAAQAVSGILRQDREILEILAATVINDIPGLLPEPLLGDVWDTQYALRPIIDAVGTRAMPQYGETFYRRYVNQHTNVDDQNVELQALGNGQAYVVNRAQVEKNTFGGYCQVSAQSADWSDPALIQQLINDMVRQYSLRTDQYVGDLVSNAATTASTTISDWTDGDQVISGLYDGAAEMRNTVGVMPTHLLVSSAIWAKMGQAKVGDNFIFPYLSPSNSAGQYQSGATVMNGNPLGLSLVVTEDISGTGGAAIIYGPAVEVYEDRTRLGGVRVDDPSTASATVGVWGYLGGLVMPNPNGSYVLSFD